jgi:hypothetical protein
MASNIREYEISKTFSNVLLSTVDSQPDTDGIPPDLTTISRRDQGRMQDGSGNASPLYVSQQDVRLTSAPASDDSIARKKEVYEGYVQSTINALIFG